MSTWWENNNLRLIQNNLRLSDANKNIKEIVDNYERLNANAALINTGGIFAFYKSKYDFAFINPNLGDRDFIAEITKECHKRNIRVIHRFDFSKIHYSIYEKNPEWAYVNSEGSIITYNGLVSTCINSEYQREKSLSLIKEVVENYNSDGVFFNMFGYVTRDYSNHYYGICRCNECRKKFKEFSGFELPENEDDDNEVLRAYRSFQNFTISERLKRIYDTVKAIDKNVAVCNYAYESVDISMSESNTEITRPYPIWDYSTAENVGKIYGSFDNIPSGDISINASSLDYRFTGINNAQLKHRFFQSLGSGGQLLWCIIGTFDDYPDKKNVSDVQSIYQLAKDNEKYINNRKNIADVILLFPYDGKVEALEEFRGIMRILKEEHILFDIVIDKYFNESHLKGKKVIIVADSIDNEVINTLSKTKIDGIHTIWTGSRWKKHNLNLSLIFPNCFEGIEFDSKWHYTKQNNNNSWAFLLGDAVRFIGKRECGLLTSGLFGPPELCGGNKESGYSLSLDNGKDTLLSFYPGRLYYKYGYDEHKRIILDTINLYYNKKIIETNAPGCVEIIYSVTDKGQIVITCISHAGFNGTSFLTPPILTPFQIRLEVENEIEVEKIIKYESNVEISFDRERHEITISNLKDFVMIVFFDKCFHKEELL